jgi:outer membrane murein-binding lipoprotein Lpp
LAKGKKRSLDSSEDRVPAPQKMTRGFEKRTLEASGRADKAAGVGGGRGWGRISRIMQRCSPRVFKRVALPKPCFDRCGPRGRDCYGGGFGRLAMKSRIGLALVYLRASLAMLLSAMLASLATTRRGFLGAPACALARRSEMVPAVCVSPRQESYRNVLAKNRPARACSSGKLGSEGLNDPRPHRAGRGAYREETMSNARTLKVGLAGAAALLMLSACVSPDQVDSLDSRVSTLESQVATAQSRASAAEARASQVEAAANQCTATCQDVRARLPR